MDSRDTASAAVGSAGPAGDAAARDGVGGASRPGALQDSSTLQEGRTPQDSSTLQEGRTPRTTAPSRTG